MNIFDKCLKSISFNKTPTGCVFSASFLADRNFIPDDIITIGQYTLQLTSYKLDKHICSVTYSTEFKPTLTGATKFIVVNHNIYKSLQEYSQLQQYIASLTGGETNVESTTIKIKLSESEYLDDIGFTPDEIFNLFGLEVSYPPVLHYKITSLQIPTNLPVISLIKMVFPFPVSINFISNTSIEVELYMENNIYFLHNACETATNEKTINFSPKIIGLPSYVKHIPEDFEFNEPYVLTYNYTDENIISYTFVKNILGKIYAIPQESTAIKKYTLPNENNIPQT